MIVALLVASCSSGGGKHSTPTTVSRTTTSTLAGPTGFESGGPNGPATSCPSRRSGESSPQLPPARSLKQTLVPIAASMVRICEYKVPKQLERFGRVVAPATVKLLEDTANRLPSSTDATCDQPSSAPFFVATFADNARQVNLVTDPCGFVTNGVRGAQGNTKWLDELRQYSTLTPMPTGPVSPAPTAVATALSRL